MISVTNESQYGSHGYDNQEPSMHAIFMAKGPDISRGSTIESVNMIDLYNLFCLILNINCAPNNGSTVHGIWNDFLVTEVQDTRSIESEQRNSWIDLIVIACIHRFFSGTECFLIISVILIIAVVVGTKILIEAIQYLGDYAVLNWLTKKEQNSPENYSIANKSAWTHASKLHEVKEPE